MTSNGAGFLERVLPFQFLPEATRRQLAARLALREFRAGDTILRQGENSRDVYLLIEGSVEVLNDRTQERLERIHAGHYFGERAALFDTPRRLTIKAAERVTAYSLPGKDFLEVVDEFPVFATALANTLKVKQGIFLAYRRLYARILSLMDQREFLLADLVPAYMELHPALHPRMNEQKLDTGALAYAIHRLPTEITRTTFYLLVGNLPQIYSDPDSLFEPVDTRARRRSAWQIFPGKLMILLRDGISDITDFLTCLCLYAVEGRKLRWRVRSLEVLQELTRLAESPDPALEADLVRRLELDAEELAGLREIWGDALWARVRELVLHHEDVGVEIDNQIDNYNSRAAEVWASELRAEASRLVDLDDPRLEVHLVSSNTHSVSNCLSPFLARRKDEILTWGRAHRPHLLGEPSPERPWGKGWREVWDLIYVLARDYLKEHPGAAEQRAAEDAAAGHRHHDVTAYTGIEVDLFDVRRLLTDACDPHLNFVAPEHPVLIVNVDYAFGQQAEEILSNLLFTFGRAVRSVNVLGKAGGLTGERGDVLLPSATLLQTNDELYPLPNADLPADLLRSLAPERAVHEGPVLTVAGTLLQDRPLLQFYRRIWKCVGLEMEGSFFARQLVSAIETSVLRPDVASRFVYYVSDVPLAPGENLSEALAPWEGVPPLYAVTRAILSRVLSPHAPDPVVGA